MRAVRKFSDILIALAVVGLIETYLHVSVDAFSAIKAGDFRSDSIGECIQKAKYHAPHLDYAIIGSSITSALDSTALGGTLSQNSMNPVECERFVVYSANILGTRRLAEEIIFPNVRPKHSIYVVSPRDVNARSNVSSINQSIPDIDLYTDSPLRYSANSWMQRHFYLYRYRSHLLSSAKNSFKQNTETPEKCKSKSTPAFDLFDADPRWKEDLNQLHASCLRQGSELTIVFLPCNPSDSSTTESFRDATGQWHSELAAWCKSRHITCFDASATTNSPEFYRDTHHLNGKGSTAFTNTFSNWIAERDQLNPSLGSL
ncbi:MAG: hypothetical protein ACI9R3_000986 [Verrucomicrobiales bacterium]|jgi:hypothetical protein